MQALDLIIWLERTGYRLSSEGGGIRFRLTGTSG